MKSINHNADNTFEAIGTTVEEIIATEKALIIEVLTPVFNKKNSKITEVLEVLLEQMENDEDIYMMVVLHYLKEVMDQMVRSEMMKEFRANTGSPEVFIKKMMDSMLENTDKK